jgi:hypothetical protein
MGGEERRRTYISVQDSQEQFTDDTHGVCGSVEFVEEALVPGVYAVL